MDSRTLGGVLLIDKPEGPTSFDAVAKVRRLYGTKKVGHTGTLDPLATGLLVVLVGRAAKAAEYLTLDDKRYSAELTLGVTTDTEDSTGEILSECREIPDEAKVLDAVRKFVGKINQVPPMYSALKIGGRKLCDLARQGETVERQPREIEIYSIDANKLSESRYSLDVHCSKGTYIRTLCADIGKELGCGGVMSALRRTACGGFSLENAVSTDDLEKMTEEERYAALSPVEALFSNLDTVKLPEFFEKLCRNGNEIYQKKIGTGYPVGTRVRIAGKNGFFALGEVMEFADGTAVKAVKNFDCE